MNPMRNSFEKREANKYFMFSDVDSTYIVFPYDMSAVCAIQFLLESFKHVVFNNSFLSTSTMYTVHDTLVFAQRVSSINFDW